jgi:CRISPR-associated endonuclease/helicase Cas3
MKRPLSDFVAHALPREDGSFEIHGVEEHLLGVAERAQEFASAFGSGEWARIAALWHDLGKYHPDFQAYIRHGTGYDADAHIETAPGRVDHSTPGAVHALDQLGDWGRIVSYAIAGHHAGLPDWESAEQGSSSLRAREQRNRPRMQMLLSQPIPDHIRSPDFVRTPPPGTAGRPSQPESPALWLRMLFSCLVDADYLDTEAFMDHERTAERGGYPDLRELARRFDRHMQRFEPEADGEGRLSTVNRARAEVLRQCRDKAALPPGLFTLTVPTGGGKTLSSMAFALRHALAYEKRRILYVIPYTSIIEQTADVFRGVFGEEAVVEHHSALEPERETLRSRLAAENWDASLCITTAVQFWESLFSARPGRCRKLHRIANSVVVLDEAQLLPPEFLKPILSVTQDLAAHYGVTFVLCTATQPELHGQDTADDFRFPGLPREAVREIIDDPEELYSELKRVEIEVPSDLRTPVAWEDLAPEIAAEHQALCIVNRRDDARDLFRLLPEQSRVHLSALMCGRHRSDVLHQIRERLGQNQPLHVVSTQLVEAGVDVDFPVVFRALAGLDSIAQAAGRCNREGRLDSGRVVIFVPPKPAPAGLLRMAADGGRHALERNAADPIAPHRFREYFADLYWKLGDRLDKHGILNLLDHQGELKIRFRTAAERFRLIPDVHLHVLVRYKNDDLLSELLDRRQRGWEPDRLLWRRMQRFIVGVPRYVHQQLAAAGKIAEWFPGVWVQEFNGLYDDELGLQTEDPALFDAADLIA